MAIRKKATKIDLANKYRYLIRDTSPFSDELFGIVHFPTRFTAGKNLFKLRIDSTNFVENSQIHIEILDSNGDPVYWEPLYYVEKDGTRVIAVYIYPETAPGLATVHVAGRVLQSAQDRISYNRDFNSPQHPDIPNAIWSRRIPIAPFASNDSEIIYTTQPSLTIKETVQAYLQPNDVFNVFTQVTSSNATLTITPEPGSLNTSNVIAPPATEGALSKNSPNFGTQFFDVSKIQSSLQNTTNTEMTSPVLTTLTGFSKLTTNNFILTKNMEGGTLTVNNPTVTVPGFTGLNSNGKVIPSSQTALEWSSNTSNIPTSQQLSGSYRFAISHVFNSSSARVALIGGFKNTSDNTNGPFSIIVGTGTPSTKVVGNVAQYTLKTSAIIRTIETATSFTASFVKPTEVVVTQNSSSFADIIVANTEPATGDVYRIKTLYKPSGFFGDFIDLGDTILEQQNILIDTGSLETNVAVGSSYEQFGTFEDLSEINTYWSASQVGTTLSASALTLGYNQGTLMGGAELITNWSGFNQYVASPGNATIFQIQPTYRPTVYAGSTYIVKFQCALPHDIELYGTEEGYIDSMRLDVYVSGSRVSVDAAQTDARLSGDFNTDISIERTLNAPFNDGGPLGIRIGTIRANNTPKQTGAIKFEFKALQTGPIDLKFVTRAGSWIVGAIEVIADKQTGFTPNYVRIFKRIPTEHLKTPLTFKFQYYDFRSNKADLETITYGAVFNGGNVYIDGNNNLMTGSTYIGNTVGSGIEMAGVSSGYLRSVGYAGFTSASQGKGPGGFLMWSGSDNLTVGVDTYLGVGLELIASSASYFRYRTNPSEIIVQTDKFFFGSQNQYISGANGNIEISSSNFHLDANGNVVMQGTITATAGNIGGFIINSSSLASSNGNMFISGSPLIGGTDNPQYMFISSSRFNVKQNGDISGSQVLFTGGKVGGFLITSQVISGSNIVIDSAGTIRTANYIPDFQGWAITANNNGFAEFENAKIRGTLSTAVFEKETVNAVGGQLYVANSTTLTSSAAFPDGTYPPSATTMSVENASGFVANEILSLKKVSPTGFSTEYIRVMSASRNNPSSDTDLSGQLFVERAYGFGLSGDSASLGNSPGTAQAYSGSQVLVSTGVSGSGYIRINANPSDPATPYIDIVERTGSGVYDVDLKARLGDLSGLAGTPMVLGRTSPGFGLATDNVYLQGGINAQFGNIGGFNIEANAITGSGFYLSGAATSSQFFLSSSNFNVKANGDVTASNALFTGIALADVIRDKTITITAANSGSYLANFNAADGAATPSYRVVMNGTLGGEITRRVRINCNLLRPIGDFTLPGIGAGERLDFILETQVATTKLLDVFIPEREGLIPATYDQITLPIGASIVLTTGGGSGTALYTIAGTHHPFDHVFQRNITVGDWDPDGGRILLQASASAPANPGLKNPSLLLDEATVFNNLRISPATVTSTTATSIGLRTMGNWDHMYSILTGVANDANQPSIALSSSLDQNDRRILLNGATQLATRIVTATGGSPDITLSISDSVIVCNHSSGTCTISVTNPTDSDTGRIIRIINRQGGTVTLTGAIYIAGSAIPDTSRTTSTRYATIELFAPGSTTVAGWIVLNETGTWS